MYMYRLGTACQDLGGIVPGATSKISVSCTPAEILFYLLVPTQLIDFSFVFISFLFLIIFNKSHADK